MYHSQSVPVYRIFQMFFLSLIACAVGVFVGSFLPPVMRLPLWFIEIGMLITAFAIRKRNIVNKPFLYIFTFISGATLYFSIAYYVSTIGAGLVLAGLIVTIFAYGGTALYAWKSKEDFSFLGGFLFAGLLGLIAIGVLNFFIPLGGMLNMVVTLFGILIFIGYTLYDVNRIRQHGVTEDELPLVVLNLYLDFINLFLYILRLLGIVNKD